MLNNAPPNHRRRPGLHPRRGSGQGPHRGLEEAEGAVWLSGRERREKRGWRGRWGSRGGSLSNPLHHPFSCPGQIYNLGTGTGYSVLQMVKAMEKASGQKVGQLHPSAAPQRPTSTAPWAPPTSLAPSPAPPPASVLGACPCASQPGGQPVGSRVGEARPAQLSHSCFLACRSHTRWWHGGKAMWLPVTPTPAWPSRSWVGQPS